MSEDDQLLIPGAAETDPDSFEVLRVWVANKAQHVSLRVGVWEDPMAWGIMLADLAGHIANSFEPAAASERLGILQRIRDGFEAEMDSPTDTSSGKTQLAH